MEVLEKIIKENMEVEKINCFESITDIVKDNNLEKYIECDMQPIEINKGKYYIITIECDYCGEKYYYIADKQNTDKTEIISYYDFESNIDYDVVCQRCVENNFYHCGHCGDLVNDYDYFWCDDDQMMYCESCADEYTFSCADCGEIHSVNNMVTIANGEEICENCFNTNYNYCENCDEIFHIDDLYYSENDGCYYCMDCYEENNCKFEYYGNTNRDNNTIEKTLQEYGELNAVCDYHHNPIDFEKRTSNTDEESEQLFFGVELEVSTSDRQNVNRASAFVADNLYCRLESDSSIPNYGFEIISDPMTYKKWYERKNKIDQVFEQLTNNNFISHNARGGNCGLHIHASREALGDTETERDNTINNIILITENFKKELQIFSRRKDYSWCHFFNDDTEKNQELNIEKIKENKGNKGRYQVINITNRNTIEFRLCRGTLKTNTFFASIQLFYNIIQLAKTNDFLNKTWMDLVKMNNFIELQQYNSERQIKSIAKIQETSKKEAEEEKGKKNLYETVIILKDYSQVDAEVCRLIIALDDLGEITEQEKQGVKNLAYFINEEVKGYYFIVKYYSNSNNVRKFEKILQNSENVLKYLTYKMEV